MRKFIQTAAAVFTLLAVAITPASALAETIGTTTFENYSLGTINGQNGWTSLGAAGSGCAMYDHAVSGSFGTAGFGNQSLRISNAVTSGCFGDQTFAAPLANAVGEADATNGTYSAGTRQPHFEMAFDLASTMPNELQPGLSMSVSPDRGDGSRMSYLRFEDQSDGVHVFFDDVSGTTASTVNFDENQIALLTRNVPHHIKLSFDAVDGPSNDVVKVWIDNVLVKTGTSWENYYRYDTEASAEQSPRIVKTVLFRTGGAAAPATLGHGFLVDNLTLMSGPTPVVSTTPENKDECKNNGWKTFTNPSFKNQGQCVSFTNHQ